MSKLILKKAETKAELDASYRLRYEVYVKKLGWLKNNYSGGLEKDEYDVLNKSSTFIAFKDGGRPIEREIVGTLRVIYPSDVILPIYRDFPECNFPVVQGACEISRLISSDVFRILNIEERSKYTKHSISLALIRALYKETWYMEKISHWFASLDVTALSLVRLLGFPFENIGDPKFYMGSITAPVVLNRGKACKAFLSNPALSKYLDKEIINEESVEEASRVLSSL